jgi:predicted glycoside hydrolase/deacetylase ChbG (UPF0249 family)
MKLNPLLKKLGFSDSDRVAILHADDVGMCQASVQAYADLDAFGLVACGAVMVPCPWFPTAAQYAREHPQTDLGVHLTLTCEYQLYRWGPVSTRDPQSGMLDSEGFLPRTSEEFQKSADLAAATAEMEAQVARAKAFGMHPSHIDTHMGTVVHPHLIKPYVDLARTHHIPLMIFRWDQRAFQRMGLDPDTAAYTARMVEEMEEQGFPLLDGIFGMPLEKPDNRLEQAKAAFASLRPGITHFIIHPSADTPELRAIAPDWRSRVADWQTFQTEELRNAVHDLGVQIIGYKQIQALFRG